MSRVLVPGGGPGVVVSYTVPEAVDLAVLHYLTFSYLAGVDVGDRRPFIRVTSKDQLVAAQFDAKTNQTTGEEGRYMFADTTEYANLSEGFQHVPMPAIIVFGGDVILVSSHGIEASDLISDVILTFGLLT